MGKEAHDVVARFADGDDAGRLRWEAPKLVFRGRARRVFEGAALAGLATDGEDLVLADGSRFKLGVVQAGRWAEAILRPPGRLDKLGIKAGQRVAVLDLDDPDFAVELAGRVAPTSTLTELDILVYGADGAEALARIGDLVPRLAERGALWVVSLKGRAAQVKDVEVMAAARLHGLVDNKVCGFSDTRTALRFVRRKTGT
ncbi:DUF3052 family protein [Caulobacter mirabilis]|uniref:DUF3052 domain-containing protein n=1 Tax=Caulobacter mirabilis TaxID=69666 RepID=A0A2D2B0M7_9CAUL|nr:DUF3052 family protein [Caulobacter mirabilis]ATQ43812.1 DUF3052 domain-containing protein [Caulobacter mirabilis]